jgi:hypothetical protein
MSRIPRITPLISSIPKKVTRAVFAPIKKEADFLGTPERLAIGFALGLFDLTAGNRFNCAITLKS